MRKCLYHTIVIILCVTASEAQGQQPKKPKLTHLEQTNLASEWKVCLSDAEKLAQSTGVLKYDWVLVDCLPYVKDGVTLTKKYVQQPKYGVNSVCASTRYFTFGCSTVRYKEEIKEAADVLVFHLWTIANSPEPPHLRWVSPTVVAVNLEEYGINPKTYGQLLFRDPYFHVGLTKDGKKVQEVAAAPGLGDPKDVEKLIKLTNSQVPLLRWDWFLVETSIQEGRDEFGTGYYNFIGVKNRDDFLKSVGVDVKQVTDLQRRWRAIVKDSGVAKNSRQVERLDSLGGGAWVTLDILDDNKGDFNALRKFGREYKHQAEEWYAIGPSGLPRTILCTEKGELQNSAPDKIGHDKTRTGNRTIIDTNASCVRCHKEILRPLDNWITSALASPNQAELPYETSEENRRLYFRNIQSKLEVDRLVFTNRLKECNGLEPKKNSDIYIYWWDRYFEDQLTVDDCVRELGTTKERLITTLNAVKVQKKLDPVLGDILISNGKINRSNWEEVFPIAMIYLNGQP